MNNRGKASIIAILSLVLAIGYAVAILILAREKNAAFWLVFGSTIFVLLSQFVFYIKVNSEGDRILFASAGMNLGLIFILIEAFVNYKLIELQTAIYAASNVSDKVSEMITNTGLVDTDSLKDSAAKVANDTAYRYIMAAQVGIIAIYIVWAVIVMRSQLFAKSIDDTLSHSTDLTKDWTNKANVIYTELKGTEYEAKAKALYEEFKYCKPQNTSGPNNLDIQIVDALDVISIMASGANKEDLPASIDKCIALIKQRNI